MVFPLSAVPKSRSRVIIRKQKHIHFDRRWMCFCHFRLGDITTPEWGSHPAKMGTEVPFQPVSLLPTCRCRLSLWRISMGGTFLRKPACRLCRICLRPACLRVLVTTAQHRKLLAHGSGWVQLPVHSRLTQQTDILVHNSVLSRSLHR